jgi:hypothetical protein
LQKVGSLPRSLDLRRESMLAPVPGSSVVICESKRVMNSVRVFSDSPACKLARHSARVATNHLSMLVASASNELLPSLDAVSNVGRRNIAKKMNVSSKRDFTRLMSVGSTLRMLARIGLMLESGARVERVMVLHT